MKWLDASGRWGQLTSDVLPYHLPTTRVSSSMTVWQGGGEVCTHEHVRTLFVVGKFDGDSLPPTWTPSQVYTAKLLYLLTTMLVDKR